MEGGGRRSPPPKDRGGGFCDGLGGDDNLVGGLLVGASSGFDDLSCGLKYTKTPEQSRGRGALVSLIEGVEDGEKVENTCGDGSLLFSLEGSINSSGQIVVEESLDVEEGEGMLWEMAVVQKEEEGSVDAGIDAEAAMSCGVALDQGMKGGGNLGGGASNSSKEQGISGCKDGRKTVGMGGGGREPLEGSVMEGVTASLINGFSYGKGIDLLFEFNPSNYSNMESNYDLSNLPIKFNMGPLDLAIVTPKLLNVGEGNVGAVGVIEAGEFEGGGPAVKEGFNGVDCVMVAADLAGFNGTDCANGESYVEGIDCRRGEEITADVANAVRVAAAAEVENSAPKMKNSTARMVDPVAKDKININM